MPFLVPGSTGVREAYIISWVSLVLTIVGLIVGLVVSVLTKSSATLGFALENAVDGISSVLVLWRFWGGGKGQSEGALAMREKRASVGIAIVFVILAITVGTAGGAGSQRRAGPAPVAVHRLRRDQPRALGVSLPQPRGGGTRADCGTGRLRGGALRALPVAASSAGAVDSAPGVAVDHPSRGPR